MFSLRSLYICNVGHGVMWEYTLDEDGAILEYWAVFCALISNV